MYRLLYLGRCYVEAKKGDILRGNLRMGLSDPRDLCQIIRFRQKRLVN